ncbi:hypothetical protein GCM10009827_099580 [Dactylosporangium maewongense]|uniref:Uncharacterized protein n=1 Tax=Dactylosporangium maewongense TaxID=634393 RepID=A0ABP4NI36_9ACTN
MLGGTVVCHAAECDLSTEGRLSSFGQLPANSPEYARGVATTNEWASTDEQREVSFEDFADELVVLPDTTTDDTDAGWGERSASNDDRLLADRPPHWD